MADTANLWQMSLFKSHFKSSSNHPSTITADSPAVTTNLESRHIKLKTAAKEKPRYSLFTDMEPK